MEKSEKDRVPIGKEREAAKLLEDAKPAMVECAKGIIGVAKVVQSITEIGYWKEEPAGSGKG